MVMVYQGCLEAYWEQGWEGRIEWAFAPDRALHPDAPLVIFLENGQQLTVFAPTGQPLWSGSIKLRPRRFWDRHSLKADIWSWTTQRGVRYADWIGWFWRVPELGLRAALVLR